jgi:hypothetical protein
MIPVQKYLYEHSPQELFTHHGIEMFPSRDGTLASVNYHQINSKKSDPMVPECRGLVLKLHEKFTGDTSRPLGETTVLGRPFLRFHNYGEGVGGPQFDLLDPRVLFEEKYDGSLVILYFNPWENSWCLATRTVPRGDVFSKRMGGSHSVRTLFEFTVQSDLNTYCKRHKFCEGETYLYELCTPLNKVHIAHEGYGATLLGIRNNLTGDERNPQEATAETGIPTPQLYCFPSVEETLRYLHGRPAKTNEGMVAKLWDGKTYTRAKIKSAGYVAATQVLGKDPAQVRRSLVTLILSGNLEDVIPTLTPEVAEQGRSLESRIREFCVAQEEGYEKIYSPGMSRKDIAVAAGKSGLHVPSCIERWEGKIPSFAAWLDSQRKETGWPDGLLDRLAKT